MKKRFLPLFILVFFSFFSFNIWAQGVKTEDSLALVDFYNINNGVEWNDTHWDFSTPVRNWDNVGVKNGRVSHLYLESEFNSGRIPSSFGNLTALERISLESSIITDTLPASFINLINLKDVWLQFYKTPFPSVLTKLPNLLGLNLDLCLFTDTLPASLGNLTGLTKLSLFGSKISGNIPSSLGNLTALTYLDLSENNFSGAIPSSLGNLTALTSLYLSENNFSGAIPGSFKNLTQLETFYLNDNQISGPIPTELMSSTRLSIFFIYANNFNYTDLEPAVSYINSNFPEDDINFWYDMQAMVPLKRKGDTLSVSPGGTFSKNSLLWYKEGTGLVATIQGDTTFIPTSTGNYFVHVYNSIAIDCILFSDTIAYNLILPDATKTVSQNISGSEIIHVNDGIYRLVSLKPVVGVNALNGSVKVTASIDQNISTFQGKPYVQRHYDITPSLNASTSKAEVTLYFTQHDFDNFNNYVTTNHLNLPLLPSDGVNNGNIRINQLHGSFSVSPDPQNYDTSNSQLITPNVAWDQVNQWWEVTFNVDGFSGFFLSTANIVLPLSLLDFKGVSNKKSIHLSWVTVNEVSTKEFVIQRGNAGNLFSDIGIVSSDSTSASGHYQFTDLHPIAGYNFYRLKMIDIDARFSYSFIININFWGNNLLLKIYPNPTSSNLSLEFTLQKPERIAFTITNTQGKSVLKSTAQCNTGTSIINVNIEKLPEGIYTLNAYINGRTENISFIKN